MNLYFKSNLGTITVTIDKEKNPSFYQLLEYASKNPRLLSQPCQEVAGFDTKFIGLDAVLFDRVRARQCLGHETCAGLFKDPSPVVAKAGTVVLHGLPGRDLYLLIIFSDFENDSDEQMAEVGTFTGGELINELFTEIGKDSDNGSKGYAPGFEIYEVVLSLEPTSTDSRVDLVSSKIAKHHATKGN